MFLLLMLTLVCIWLVLSYCTSGGLVHQTCVKMDGFYVVSEDTIWTDLLNTRVQGLQFLTVFTSSHWINRITLFYKNMYNLYIDVTSVPTCSLKTKLIGTMSTTSDAPDVISVNFLNSYNVIN
jgi:hypothetical protein